MTIDNVAPTISVSRTSVSGPILTEMSNSGTFGDMPGDNVSISASLGTVTQTLDTWRWNYTPPSTVTNQSITITATDKDGGISTVSFLITVQPAVVAASIANTQLFYRAIGTNALIGNATNPTARIDASKLALQPGQTASLIGAASGGSANYIKYYSGFIAGINGLVVDITNSAGVPTAADFEFRTWNGLSGNPATSFVLTTATPTVTNLGLVGINGSRRMKIEFQDNAIKNTWLQVTVNVSPNTGLLTPNVFYFGSAAGDVGIGNSLNVGFWRVGVSPADSSSILLNQTSPNAASISNVFDIGKNLGVSGADRSQALLQPQSVAILRFFDAPAPPAPPTSLAVMAAATALETSLFTPPIYITNAVTPSKPSVAKTDTNLNLTVLQYEIPQSQSPPVQIPLVQIPSNSVSEGKDPGIILSADEKKLKKIQSLDQFFAELGRQE